MTASNGEYKVVEGLKIDDASRERLSKTEQELKDEKKALADLLN